MRIAHVASEMAPFAKVGGLGDVVLGLCRELQTQGHQPTVVLPLYGTLDRTVLGPLRRLDQCDSTVGDSTIWSTDYEGLPLWLIEPKDGSFDRPSIYGWPDDVERFSQFSQAAWRWLARQPLDLIHCHDWQTACLTPLAAGKMPTLLTLHNIDYQGACAPEQLEPLGLLNEDNCLRAGIRAASHIAAVSPTYSREIQTPLGGRGLDALLRSRSQQLSPVLNGIDTTYWNPATDPLLTSHLDPDGPLPFKWANREALSNRLGLRFDPSRPLVGVVARLVPQKGIALIQAALRHTLQQGGQFVLLGSCGSPEIQAQFESLQEGPDLQLCLTHDEATAHQIFAASDLFLVPSLFEPCGLTQLIALHYGAIPLVRRTGGLADTIFDLEHEANGNGFVFDDPTPPAICATLSRALHRWHHTPQDWTTWVRQAMRQDVSWRRSATTYANLYEQLVDSN